MTINDRIKAVHVIQRFVLMSRTLLPSFSELMSKENLSKSEERKAKRIRDVYDSFKPNPEMSVKMVNSNIFQLIMEVYRNTGKRQGQTPETFHVYDEFLKESDRLLDAWNRQKLN
jgi:hypothetical protein